GKTVRIKGVVVGIFSGVQLMERGDLVGFASRGEIDAAGQLIIIVGLKMNGKSGLELGNSGNCPAIQDLTGHAGERRNRKLVEIAHNKPVRGVEKRHAAGTTGIEWIQDVLETRGLIQ